MKILIIEPQGLSHLAITKEHLSQIREVGPNIEVVATSGPQEVSHHLPSSEVMVGIFRDLPSIKEAKQLKWVHGLGAGADALSPEIINAPVLVSNSSGVAAIPIAEHVLGFMLVFTRKFFRTFRNQQEKRWERQKDLAELRGKTVLVAGLGHIGLEVARLSSCLGAFVIAVDREGKEKPDFVAELKTPQHLDEMLPRADFVVICLPYTKETHHLFGREQFNYMKAASVLINIGRGGLVDEKALIDALEKGIIGGAALDVTEKEPLPKESPFWDIPNVIITPHHSGLSEKYMGRAVDVFLENLKAFLKGEPLPNLVDKTAGY